jgi:hypothetical protein
MGATETFFFSIVFITQYLLPLFYVINEKANGLYQLTQALLPTKVIRSCELG